jgi:chromosome transmission fidelity protein 18
LHCTVKNFLGVNASRAKAARKARAAALVGFEKSVKKQKISYTGSGIPLSQVIRFKYQRGFSQAVRVPCKIEDLL